MAMKKIVCALLAFCLMLVLLYRPGLLFSCGPFSLRAVFTYAIHPDFPLEKFVRGELGVLQSSYEWPALYVAYRHLMGIGLDQEEQRAVLALWNTRLGLQRTFPGGEPVKDWLDTRSKVPGAQPVPELSVYRSVEPYYFSYLNCPDAAFRTAASTLTQRIAQFDADSPAVQDWLVAQDQVFANCPGGRTIPATASPTLPPLLQADRTYQIAAAHFYAGDFAVAKQMFVDITKDASSPWSQLAPYLIARTLLRKATLNAGPNRTDMDTLAQAEEQLGKVLSDSDLAAVHPDAQRLLNRVRALLHPAQRLEELATAILQKNSETTLEQELWDYRILSRTIPNEQLEELRANKSKDAFADWVRTFAGNDESAFPYAWQKWQETASPAWLVAALVNSHGRQPMLPTILEAAAQVTPDSPAFLTVTFHRLRLLIEAERKDEARERLDAILSPSSPALSPSVHNLFLAQRMQLARDLDEFLHYAPRQLIGITVDIYEDREMPLDLTTNENLKKFADERSLLDGDATGMLNSLPFTLLKRAVTSTVLPVHMRRELALAAWIKAVLLENDEMGRAFASLAGNLLPEL